MLAALLRRVVADEQLVLDSYDLTMWDYAVLYALRSGPVASQSELAELTGRDKTRLIRHLDGLEKRDLIARTPSVTDRRHHVVALTRGGRRLLQRCHRRIKDGEARTLENVSPADAEEFVRILGRLTSQ